MGASFYIMGCLDNIISIRGYCETESLSGLDLMDAPELSSLNLSAIANEDVKNGFTLANEKIALATKLIRNDIMSVMAANNVLPEITDIHYNTGVFRTNNVIASDPVYRGLVLYKNRRTSGKLRKNKIHKISVFPLNDATDVIIKIIDAYPSNDLVTETSMIVDLTGNQVNEIEVDYTVQGEWVKVIMDGTDVSVASSYLTCFTGCNGTMPNDCGYTKGYYNNKEITAKEGYGIVLDFSCYCDYEQLICDLSKLYIGEIVWLKTRVLLLEEHIKSNRLNNWIIYNREETKEYLTDVENQYRNKWNVFVNAMPRILKQYRDSCLDCRGARWIDNI